MTPAHLALSKKLKDPKRLDTLTVSCALVLIAEKSKFQANRTTDTEANTSLLEIRQHAVFALNLLKEHC